MRLLLVRHGQTPSNLRNLLDTAVPGPGLTELGERQAAAIPEALSAEDVGAVYASTLVRAQLTAAPLAKARRLPVDVRDGLREVAAGELEMLGDPDAAARFLSILFAWSSGDTGLRMPGGETGAETLARFDEVVSEAAADGSGTAVLVSHGAVIRMWTAARAQNVDTAFAAANPLTNTGIVTLEGDPATGWRALSWTGTALGGPQLTDPTTDGPAADRLAVPELDRR